MLGYNKDKYIPDQGVAMFRDGLYKTIVKKLGDYAFIGMVATVAGIAVAVTMCDGCDPDRKELSSIVEDSYEKNSC